MQEFASNSPPPDGEIDRSRARAVCIVRPHGWGRAGIGSAEMFARGSRILSRPSTVAQLIDHMIIVDTIKPIRRPDRDAIFICADRRGVRGNATTISPAEWEGETSARQKLAVQGDDGKERERSAISFFHSDGFSFLRLRFPYVLAAGVCAVQALLSALHLPRHAVPDEPFMDVAT